MHNVITIMWLEGTVFSSVTFGVITSDQPGSHATTPGELAFEINPDGVVSIAWNSDPNVLWSHSCTGALITDRQILTAAHCFDESRDGIVDASLAGITHVVAFDLPTGRLIRQLDLSLTRITPQWYETDEAADLAIVELVESAPEAAPCYPLYGGRDETASPFILIGYGHLGTGASGDQGPSHPYPWKQADFIAQATHGLARWQGVLGDFNEDGRFRLEDLEALQAEIRRGANVTAFDANQDGQVSVSDQMLWVRQLKRTHLGDVDLDGLFNSLDLIEVFQIGHYEDGVPNNSRWSTGDWDTDGEFTTNDLVGAFHDGGYQVGSRAVVEAVPEPNATQLLAISLSAFLKWRRTENR